MPEDVALFDLVVERLAAVRLQLGPAAFRDAAGRALNGIARAALAEAERRAKRPPKKETGVVIRFPFRGKG